jgi:biotin synthase
MTRVADILKKPELSRQDIIALLSIAEKNDQDALIKRAYELKESTVGKKVHLRGLIEVSNICHKDCLYCGIRSGNTHITRYSIPDEEILRIVWFAVKEQLTGVVIQAGERNRADFTKRITVLLSKIKQETNSDFRITLSLGEQSPDTYREWFDAGAQRYLLRMETTSEELYRKIHPDDEQHRFQVRLKCLETIQKVGFQTGTGVMIGLPFQTMEHLADDLLFMKRMDMDMVGMGPYLEHPDTPLYCYKEMLVPVQERLKLSLRMMAVLRILVPEMNIASTTALQAIHPKGRELGLKAGANVLMPNLTPIKYKNSYRLYEAKPGLTEAAEECLEDISGRVSMIGEEIVYHDYGDSKHFINKEARK